MWGNLRRLAPPFLQSYKGHLSEEAHCRVCVVFWATRHEDAMQVRGQSYLHLFLPAWARPWVHLSPNSQKTQSKAILHCILSYPSSFPDTTDQLNDIFVSQKEFVCHFTHTACSAVLSLQTSLSALFIPSICLNSDQWWFLQEASPDIPASRPYPLLCSQRSLFTPTVSSHQAAHLSFWMLGFL